MEGAVRIDFTASHGIGGPGEDVDGQKSVGSGSGGELDVGGGDEEATFVETVEGLAVESGDADAKSGVAERWVGEDMLNAVSELAGFRCGTGGRMGGSRLLGGEACGEQEG